jgi:2-polyprenyl-3-methyl-5-hydroxy-6-metoxy-1,4-benzoquinol methylase
MFEVIEHLENPTASLEEVHITLKPEGRATITTPDLFSLEVDPESAEKRTV